MPGGDRTGPRGFGPMTGRGAGYCSGFGAPGFASTGYGRGFGLGWGRGGGRGWRNRYYATGIPGWQAAAGWAPYGPSTAYTAPYPATSREQQLDSLKGQAEYFEDALEDIRKRIADIEARSQETLPFGR